MENKNISNFLNESDCESFENIDDIKLNKYLSKYTSKQVERGLKLKRSI